MAGPPLSSIEVEKSPSFEGCGQRHNLCIIRGAALMTGSTRRRKEIIPSHHSIHRSGNQDRRGLDQTVQETDELIQQAVERLSRGYPPHLVGEAARDDLLDLRPHLQAALAALESIEQRRDLTAEELTLRRAFKMLLTETLLPRGSE
jgi:hypothetical protein